ncbi:MAG: proline dehydrogenase family protein [Desulfobacterales bacterium]|nr:proline dehydrogenase family protein [Desulfobacterales bacterium]
MKTTNLDPIVAEAIAQAKAWQQRANELLTAEEKAIQDQMQRLVNNPADKVVLTKMIDQSFRSSDTARIADQINSILRENGVPDFFSSVDKLLVQMFLGLGRHFPNFTIPKMVGKMRHDSSRAIIAGEDDLLKAHLQKRQAQGVRMNINHLGEALLGESEAQHRLQMYMSDLQNPGIETISVKISTIYSQISALAFEHTLSILIERLAQLYRTAMAHPYVRPDGSQRAKMVNMDMEEYRDLEITAEAFKRTLNQDEFKSYGAGIVLQAYLPDSYSIQKDLTEWARQRVAAGGSPISLRIVKGANMEMEQVDAALHNWPLAPYDNKLEVDANFKRMVDYGMQTDNIAAVRLGVASHNLFELAYANQRAQQNDVVDCFTFELLEGMADHVRRALQETSGDVLLYAPVASKDQFINAIAYLIRRLDENTSDENFLRHSFQLRTDSSTWKYLQNQFVASYNFREKAKATPNRIQNRLQEVYTSRCGTYHTGQFTNEPDTDWSLASNRKWAEAIRAKWMKKSSEKPVEIPVVAGNREQFADRQTREYLDPNRPDAQIVVARFALANDDDVNRAVAAAKDDPDAWRKKTYKQRHKILAEVAQRLRAARGDLIGAAAANTGKIFTEADPEVSEAIDFTEFYPYTARQLADSENMRCKGKGVGLVIAPWNFPIAISCGGIVAALAAGNTVIYKPSSDSVLVAWLLCQCFWDAGISKNVLQMLPCSGSTTGAALVNHPDVDFIILTGGTETGLSILENRPNVLLAAETGGKNTTIVTAMSDRDQAVKNIIHSAFSNSGQKCSATSLLILEKEVYMDETFKAQLKDAAQSYRTGSAWQFENKMGPLIKPPQGDLKRALSDLEPGEKWLVKPKNIDNNPRLWSPGIKWGVQPGSYTHTTEFFGPVLGVMGAEDLEQAIAHANQTGYGLTAGLESLDTREQKLWQETIECGNLYMNRGTTGAIVLRQPFGGMKKSALGAGIKAGGPNYVAQFMMFEEAKPPSFGPIQYDHPLLQLALEWERKLNWGQLQGHLEDIQKTVWAIKSYIYQAENEFFPVKDYFHLRGQDNLLRYLPVGTVVVRLHRDDSLFDVLARIAAVVISKCDVIISVPPELNNSVTQFIESTDGKKFLRSLQLTRQTDQELMALMPDVQRFRYADQSRVPESVFKAAAKIGFFISREKVLMEGRIELLRYFKEQSICIDYHRYGNLGERSMA